MFIEFCLSHVICFYCLWFLLILILGVLFPYVSSYSCLFSQYLIRNVISRNYMKPRMIAFSYGRFLFAYSRSLWALLFQEHLNRYLGFVQTTQDHLWSNLLLPCFPAISEQCRQAVRSERDEVSSPLSPDSAHQGAYI